MNTWERAIHLTRPLVPWEHNPAYPTDVVARIGPVELHLEKRPDYCDRGRMLFHAQSHDPAEITIDHADLFPRYYFSEVAFAIELDKWLEARGLYEHPEYLKMKAMEELPV